MNPFDSCVFSLSSVFSRNSFVMSVANSCFDVFLTMRHLNAVCARPPPPNNIFSGVPDNLVVLIYTLEGKEVLPGPRTYHKRYHSRFQPEARGADHQTTVRFPKLKKMPSIPQLSHTFYLGQQSLKFRFSVVRTSKLIWHRSISCD